MANCLYSGLETATDDEITADDETSTDLSEDKAGVLSSILRLELTLTDGELLISGLETATDDEITADDETSTDLSEDKAGVLSSILRLELTLTDGELLILWA